jgi:hypothetical protein
MNRERFFARIASHAQSQAGRPPALLKAMSGNPLLALLRGEIVAILTHSSDPLRGRNRAPASELNRSQVVSPPLRQAVLPPTRSMSD